MKLLTSLSETATAYRNNPIVKLAENDYKMYRMKSVEQHISDLLREHDCVIVPEVGGFFTVKTPARYHPDRHKFSAPAKRVSFNKELKHNDGLLINAVSREEKVDYNAAKAHVEQFSASLKKAFDNREGVTLSCLGTLYFDEEQKLRFEPDESVNYDRETFALEDFHASPVLKEKEIQAPGAGGDANSKSPPSSPTSRKSRLKYAAAAAIALPVVGYLGWLATSTGLFKSDQSFTTADLNPFSDKLCELYKPRQSASKFSPEEFEITRESIVFESGFAELRLVDSVKRPLIVGMKDREIYSTDIARGNFHVITGAFRDQNNARKMIARLNASGYNGYIVDVENGLHRVSAGRFESRGEAYAALERAKAEIQDGSWMLVK